MRHAHPSSLSSVLAAPWQQRVNTGGYRGVALVVAICFSVPAVLCVLSLFRGPSEAAAMRNGMRAGAMVGVGALLLCAWAVLVGNVLQQNTPTLARLLPGQVARLRTALLVAWAMVVLLAAGGPGFLFDAPLAWACGTAAILLLLAAALRWPWLWLFGIAAPFVARPFMDWPWHGAFSAALVLEWHRVDWLASAIVAVGGVAVLMRMIESGGPRHVAIFDARRRRGQPLQVADLGAATRSPQNARATLAKLAFHPYQVWTAHVLARTDSPLGARLLIGLGPASHWTSRLAEAFCALAASSALFALFTAFASPGLRPTMLAWASFAALTALASSAPQAPAKLHQTRREQALLVLLPGVPRGAVLNRWLAWQMSLPIVGAVAAALAVWYGLQSLADHLEPGVTESLMGSTGKTFAIALLPSVAWGWRCWARLVTPTTFSLIVTGLSLVALVFAAVGLHLYAGMGWLAIGVGFAVATLARCAWRWHRMGREPSAFPVGRLAR